MESSELPTPVSTSDKYLAQMCGMDVDELPIPISREDKQLAKLCGMEVELEKPIGRHEQYFTFLNANGGLSPGDNTLLDSIIDRSITAINNSTCTILGANALYGCSSLISVNFPNVTEIKSNALRTCSALITVKLPSCTNTGAAALYGCTALTTIRLPSITVLATQTFRGCSSLSELILGNSAMCTMGSPDALADTPITNGEGYIYVPAALVAEYKTATNWSVYADQIRAIEDYPEICGEVTA